MLDFGENNLGSVYMKTLLSAGTHEEVDSGKWTATSSETKGKTLRTQIGIFNPFPRKSLHSSVPTTFKRKTDQ